MFLMRSVLFYPLLAVFGCALTWWSLLPAITPRPSGAVAAVESPEGFVFNLAALGRIQADPAQPLYVERTRAGETLAVRLAIQPGAAAPTANDLGARIELDAATAQALSEAPLEIELDVKGFATLAAESVAVSVQGDSPVEWRTIALLKERGKITLQVPPSPGVKAIALRPVSVQADGPRGFDVFSVTVRRLP